MFSMCFARSESRSNSPAPEDTERVSWTAVFCWLGHTACEILLGYYPAPNGSSLMAIPEFQSFMLPLLKFAGDGKPHTIAEAREALSTSLGITPDDRKELLPSGSQSRFDNRVTWARTYLTKALLLSRLGRGSFQITDRG